MNDLLITKLKMARLDAKLTQDDVSKKLGIKPNTLSNWETGRTQPDIDTFVELCRIYNIDCGSLLADVYAFDKVKYMTKKEIGSRLKTARIKAGKTQMEVAQILGKTQQNIGHWETGYSQPDADTLFTLCDIYGQTADEVFGFKSNAGKYISPDELEHIQRWRMLDDESRDFVSSILEREIKTAETIEGMQDEILNMRQSPQNIIEISERQKRRYCIPYYNKIASAGHAIDSFSDMIGGIMEIDDTPENRKGNYAIGVLGNSMEPTYYDGDIVLVKNAEHLKKGDIGIFQKDNGVYIKEVGDDGLVSHNPAYGPIKEDTIIKIMGKVLKKIDPAEGEIIS